MKTANTMNSMNSGKKETVYLVTSAAGFMGGQVVRQLLARGDRVRAFVLRGDPGVKYVPSEAEIVEGDVRDYESLERFFQVPAGVETVVLHIASVVSMDEAYNQKVMDINVGGTKNILKLCLRHRECRKLVYVSSTGAIPERPKGENITEPEWFDPDSVRGCYSKSKAMATQAVLDAVEKDGLNACVVYPAGIMGPEDSALSNETTGTLLKLINGGMPAGIDGSFNLADVRDLARGIILAADKGAAGAGYILGNEEITFRQFAEIVAEESGCKKIRTFIPIWAANGMAVCMEAKAKLTGGKPLMTRFSIYNLARNNAFDSSRAKRELGYTTRSYRETMRDEIAWMKDAGLIANPAKPVYNGVRKAAAAH